MKSSSAKDRSSGHHTTGTTDEHLPTYRSACTNLVSVHVESGESALNSEHFADTIDEARPLFSLPDTDQFLAAAILLSLFPLLIVRALRGWYLNGRILDTRQTLLGVRSVNLYRFSGYRTGRRLPLLFNVLCGDLRLFGIDLDVARKHSESEFRIRPSTQTAFGIFSFQAMRRMTGTDYDEDIIEELPKTIKTKLAFLFRYAVARLLQNVSALACPERFSVLGVDIDNMTFDEALKDIMDAANEDGSSQYAFVNPDCLNQASQSSEYRAVLGKQRRVFADGIGIQVAARMLNKVSKANVNGTDLFPMLCEACVHHDHSIYLLGGREGVAANAAQSIQTRFPALKIAGFQHGYFSEEERDSVIDDINRSGAAILLVAMGAPTQELWLDAHRDALKVPVHMGVGGLFDFFSGRITRCPRWMQDIGAEWVWRLMQEPQRMWRRYVLGNPAFLYRVARQKLSGKESRINPRFTRDSDTSLRSTMRLWTHRASWKLFIGSTYGIKRCVDILISLCAIAALLPVFIAVGMCIRVESPGPIFFAQTRIGKHGRYFRIYKFRSMFIDAERRKAELMENNEMQGGVIFKMKSDPRVTRVGRIVRKFSLDELPQLFNVLLGDMSLVGPRPPVPSEVDSYSIEDRRRLEIKPGITCIWQVSGRSDIPFDKQVSLDVDYIESHSLREDIRILLQTVPAVLFGKGAY